MNSNNIDEHSKTIRKESIIYFAQKLKKKYKFLKNILYIHLIITLIDLFLILLFNKYLLSLVNCLVILIIMFSTIYSLFIFKQHNFEYVNYLIYWSTVRVMYIELISLILFYLDMIYILFYNVIKDVEKLLSFFDKNIFKIVFVLIFFICYLILNLTFPIVVIMNINEVKKNIKDLGTAKGESYESLPSDDNIINDNNINISNKL